MWHVAVVSRFEAVQAFLASDERESVKAALFEQWGTTRVNDKASVKAAETSGASSAHLERWEKWKLKGEIIDRLTSSASKEADAALATLDAKVANVRFFARGKRGVLYAGELRSDNAPVVVKLAADVASVRSVTQEARWLRVMNRMAIGPKLMDAGTGWFLCERLEGENVVEFLGLNDKVATPANAMWIIREMLCQCFAMDLMRVNKEEMTHPHRHIIVHRSSEQRGRWRCTFIDFEKCAFTKKPKNVTQLCQFLSTPRMLALLATKHVKVDVIKLRQCTKRYKQNLSTHMFDNIMRVFRLCV